MGSQTSVTASQISTANSSSVPVKDSGEYSKRISVSGMPSASLRTSRAPWTAMSTMPALSELKTTRRCSVDVELYRCTIACFAPTRDSKVRSISSSRAWVSTWMVTSSGISPSSISCRTKS
ncbi:unannotated protein [freshwater metagenome]|uniref:Unannotated protein n=1 Tax=freshwater metagenome TaxID=449393 RepID=A0A6J7HNX1_9ZZZZ